MTTWKIMGKYKDRPWEELDEIEGLREAARVAQEYRVAFGEGWVIRKEKV